MKCWATTKLSYLKLLNFTVKWENVNNFRTHKLRRNMLFLSCVQLRYAQLSDCLTVASARAYVQNQLNGRSRLRMPVEGLFTFAPAKYSI